MQGDPRKYETYLATRPKSFEADAVRLLVDVLRSSRDQAMKPGFHLLIVHLANADLLKEIKTAQAEGNMVPTACNSATFRAAPSIACLCGCAHVCGCTSALHVRNPQGFFAHKVAPLSSTCVPVGSLSLYRANTPLPVLPVVSRPGSL